MNLFCGIDPSLTGTGLVILDQNYNITLQTLICSNSKNDIERRIMYIWESIFQSIKEDNDSMLFNIEGLSFGSKGQSMLELAALHYYIRIKLNQLDCKYYITPPTTLKKFITGKGNVKKELMLLNVYKKFGVEFSDSNICDAYSLARFLLDEEIKDEC